VQNTRPADFLPVGSSPPLIRGKTNKVALMLGGGGARAAYHAGFLRRLGELHPDLCFPILNGVSAGAINIACLGSGTGSFRENTVRLADFWSNITVSQVFRTDWAATLASMLRWAGRLVTGGSGLAPRIRSLVNTGPLREFLSAALQPAADGRLQGVADNVRRGHLEAVAVTTTNYLSGISTTWVESREVVSWSRPGRVGLPADLGLDHVMASCALPLFFPAVRLENAWHGDGGIRLVSPLSPAIHLGATKILAISTRPARPFPTTDPIQPVAYPAPASIIGQMLDAVFLDVLDQDALHLQRLNHLLAGHPRQNLDGLSKVELLLVRPTVDIAALAAAHERDLPRAFRFATRGLGTRDTAQSDLLATVMFSHGYVGQLMAIGARDAESRSEEIAAFVRG
jgi:NTE family protein